MLKSMLGLQLEIAQLDLRLYELKTSEKTDSEEYKDLSERIKTKKLQLEELMDSLKPTIIHD